MMRGTAAVAAMGASLLLATPAPAGTYDVVSCGAPGAGGVNRAWTGRADDPNTTEVRDCGADLFGGSTVAQRTTPFFNGASWTFTAPAGTRIARLVSWRWGRYFGNGWRVTARDGTGNIIGGQLFGETCNIPSGQLGCEFGSNTGVSSASRVQYDVDTNQVFYSAACESTSGCPTSNGETRFAEFHVFGTAVTIRDDGAPSLTVGGPLLTAGWRRPGESQDVTFSASDATGILGVSLGGAAAGASNRSCDYTRPAPCSNATGRLTPGPRLPEGVHDVTITALDAAANPATVRRTVRIDGTPPTARVSVARRGTILVDVGDDVSGVERGEIQVRDHSRAPFRALPTTLANGRLRARMDRGRAERSDIRVVVRDVAGNQREGLGSKLRISSARTRGRRLKVRGGRVNVPNGRAVRVRGRLSLIRGASVGGAEVLATTTVVRGGPTAAAGRATTSRSGRFSLRLPAGPSRVLQLSSPGSGGALGATGRLSVRVPAASSIRASRRSFSGPARIRFSGRVRAGGRPLPPSGLVIILQGREDGRWSTFEDTRTDARGRWSVSYPFRGVPGTYPIRALIRRQGSFPFEAGHSRALRVRIR